MKKSLLFFFASLFIISITSITINAQWAQNKNARQDAIYARTLQPGEDIVVDGVEDAVWAEADSVVLGYGQTDYLPSSGYNLQSGQSIAGDSANAVCKFLYKAPYLYLLYKTVDKSVGGKDWEQSDAIIQAFKKYNHVHLWDQAWDNRVEHFYTYLWIWDTTAITVGEQPWFRGAAEVDGGRMWKRTPAQKERWMAVSTVLGGTSNDSLPDQGWVSEHRVRIDSLGFKTDGDVLPFSFSVFDGDRFLDSSTTNNAHSKTWWGCEWNENWYYNAVFIDPNVTTATAGNPIPPVDYTIPHLNTGATITVDGNMSEWDPNNTLHFRAKWGDDAAFDTIKGTGAWASGYQQMDWNGKQTVVDGPEVDYWVTWDNENLYVAAKVADQIVTMPQEGRKDGISLFLLDRTYRAGMGIYPAKTLTVNVDSLGAAQAGDDLISLADTAGVQYALTLGNTTNINDISEVDSGFSVEMKIPFASLNYPATLGDSVVFIGGLVNDVDVFEDIAGNYQAKSWWFKQEPGQKACAWVVLGPPNGTVGVNDKPVIPTSVELFNNYPNPFNPVTKIKYSVNVNSDVTLSVYNTLGQIVSEMKQTGVKAGYGEFNFNAGSLSSGVYFYQLKVKNLSSSENLDSKVNKMILLK